LTINEWALVINAAAIISATVAEELLDVTYPFRERRRLKREAKKHGEVLQE
jgi:hypothetical protein